MWSDYWIPVWGSPTPLLLVITFVSTYRPIHDMHSYLSYNLGEEGSSRRWPWERGWSFLYLKWEVWSFLGLKVSLSACFERSCCFFIVFVCLCMCVCLFLFYYYYLHYYYYYYYLIVFISSSTNHPPGHKPPTTWELTRNCKSAKAQGL